MVAGSLNQVSRFKGKNTFLFGTKFSFLSHVQSPFFLAQQNFGENLPASLPRDYGLAWQADILNILLPSSQKYYVTEAVPSPRSGFGGISPPKLKHETL